MIWKLIAVYLAAISLVSVIITVYDKRVSRISGRRRVPEKTLMLLALMGGSLAMYVTMYIVRHKTRHLKFVIGIPAIIILQYGVFMLIYNSLR